MNVRGVTLSICAIASMLVVGSIGAVAQTPCVNALDAAAQAFDEGRLDDVIALLVPCNDLSRDKAWQRSRLLALAFLFSDRPSEADAAVYEMLQLNPGYEVDELHDPIELVRIIEQYSIVPRFEAGARIGISKSGRRVYEQRLIAPLSDGGSDARFVLGNDLGLTMGMTIGTALSMSVEASYSTRAYGFDRTTTTGLTTTYTERLSYLTLPLLARFRFATGAIRPHISAGYFFKIRLGATSDVTGMPAAGGESFSDAGVLSTDDRRTSSDHGPLAGIGVDVSVGPGALTIDGRYEFGLADITRADTRFTDSDLLYRYLYVDDAFHLHSFILSIGYVLPFGYSATR
jgi:hypothetical protein